MRTISQADLAVRLRLVIARTARRLRQEAGEELSPSQAAALATIDRHGPLTPSELAVRERVQRPTATRVIARLEETGLVDRTQDPADRRSCVVALTPRAMSCWRACAPARTPTSRAACATSTPAERATLDRAAAILERVLEEAGA
jgi:DNA-binding MarR family transcriptional regulator